MSALCRGVSSGFCNILDDVKSHIDKTTITPTYYTPRALTSWGTLSHCDFLLILSARPVIIWSFSGGTHTCTCPSTSSTSSSPGPRVSRSTSLFLWEGRVTFTWDQTSQRVKQMFVSPQMRLSLLGYACRSFDRSCDHARLGFSRMVVFSPQVLLFSMPCLEDLYSQCCNLSKDGQTQEEAVHPTTLLKVRTFSPQYLWNHTIQVPELGFYCDAPKNLLVNNS